MADGLPSARAGSIGVHEQLAQRIVRMRNRSMTLQAICDRLNADGVPTPPRGGSMWRPKSLRAVLSS
jgi:hypothetical protein